ncbi:mitochodrial transcription termination factor [Tanacetum coccineum]
MTEDLYGQDQKECGQQGRPRMLDNNLRYLRVLLGFDDAKVFKVVSRSWWKLASDYEKKISENILVLRKYGLSSHKIESLLLRNPGCLLRHAEWLDGVVKKVEPLLGIRLWGEYFQTHPQVLVYSLEKRVIPRYKVLASLKEKSALKSKLSFCSVVALSEEKFVRDFVLPYCEVVPSLYENYTKSTRGDMEGCNWLANVLKLDN